MRVLLDENIDRFLKGLFADEFEVMTMSDCGWQGKANGELLRAAEQEFDAFVTMDQNLEYQQNLRTLNLGVIVLRARSNAYKVVASLMPKVNEVLRSIQPAKWFTCRPNNAVERDAAKSAAPFTLIIGPLRRLKVTCHDLRFETRIR